MKRSIVKGNPIELWMLEYIRRDNSLVLLRTGLCHPGPVHGRWSSHVLLCPPSKDICITNVASPTSWYMAGPTDNTITEISFILRLVA